MKEFNIVQFSGGKDSTALLCWAKENLEDFIAVYNDTGFEDSWTYNYINEITSKLGVQLIIIKPKKNFLEVVKEKGRFPASKSKFCTVKLKIEPFIDILLRFCKDTFPVYEKIRIFQGIRNEESRSRASMPVIDEYFKHYFEKRKNGKKDSYRRKEVLELCEKIDFEVVRPLKNYSFKQVFDLIKKHELEPHKHYLQGFARVGCFPCVQSNGTDIRQMIRHYPERIELIREKEKEFDSTFFPPGTIPVRFCTKKVITKKNEVKFVPTIDDVVKYLSDNPNQILMFEAGSSCESVYNQCA